MSPGLEQGRIRQGAGQGLSPLRPPRRARSLQIPGAKPGSGDGGGGGGEGWGKETGAERARPGTAAGHPIPRIGKKNRATAFLWDPSSQIWLVGGGLPAVQPRSQH